MCGERLILPEKGSRDQKKEGVGKGLRKGKEILGGEGIERGGKRKSGPIDSEG